MNPATVFLPLMSGSRPRNSWSPARFLLASRPGLEDAGMLTITAAHQKEGCGNAMAREKTTSNKVLRQASAGNNSSGSNSTASSQHGLPGEAQPNDSVPESKQASDKTSPVGENLSVGTLYIVATPIGNAADISLRALETLKQVDMVACEDTRVTAKLFARHGIHTSLSAYHEHNADKARPRLIKRLKQGETVALVSDAGTPMVSDPGYKLIQACIEQDVPITTLPGASSVLAALVLSGLPTDRFFFGGFLPQKKGPRRALLEKFAAIPSTLVLLESPRRFAASLADMVMVLGNREAAVSRELTKLYEETRRGTLQELADAYATEAAPKGEAVVVIGPPLQKPDMSDAEVDALLVAALERTTLRDAVREVTDLAGRPRQVIYQRALTLNANRGTARDPATDDD